MINKFKLTKKSERLMENNYFFREDEINEVSPVENTLSELSCIVNLLEEHLDSVIPEQYY